MSKKIDDKYALLWFAYPFAVPVFLLGSLGITLRQYAVDMYNEVRAANKEWITWWGKQ